MCQQGQQWWRFQRRCLRPTEQPVPRRHLKLTVEDDAVRRFLLQTLRSEATLGIRYAEWLRGAFLATVWRSNTCAYSLLLRGNACELAQTLT